MVEDPVAEVPELAVPEVEPELVVPPENVAPPVMVDNPPLTRAEVPDVDVVVVGVRVVISPERNWRCSRAWAAQRSTARLRRRRWPVREANVFHQSRNDSDAMEGLDGGRV